MDALPNGLDVTFDVTELRRMTGSYNTMVGNNEGCMVSDGLYSMHRFNSFLTSYRLASFSTVLEEKVQDPSPRTFSNAF